MKRTNYWIFSICMVTVLGSCKKEQLIVHKDDSNAVLDVTIQKTEIEANPFDIRYTSAGWMVFQEDQTPYVKRLDTLGKLLSQADALTKGTGFYGEMLVEDEAGVLFRCTNQSLDSTKLIIQELDADYAVISETEILDAPVTLRVTGFKYAGAGSFVFSAESGGASVPARIYFYEGISKTLFKLCESPRGILIDYIRTTKGFQYLAVENYFSGASLSILIFDKNGLLVRDIAAPDFVRTYRMNPQGKFLGDNSNITFVYSSKTIMSSMVFNDFTNQLIQGPSAFALTNHYSRPTLLDFQFGKYGRIWMLSLDEGRYSRNLVLSEYANNGKLLWTRALSGSGHLIGMGRLRMSVDGQWQIMAASSRYTSGPLSLINP